MNSFMLGEKLKVLIKIAMVLVLWWLWFAVCSVRTGLWALLRILFIFLIPVIKKLKLCAVILSILRLLNFLEALSLLFVLQVMVKAVFTLVLLVVVKVTLWFSWAVFWCVPKLWTARPLLLWRTESTSTISCTPSSPSAPHSCARHRCRQKARCIWRNC